MKKTVNRHRKYRTAAEAKAALRERQARYMREGHAKATYVTPRINLDATHAAALRLLCTEWSCGPTAAVRRAVADAAAAISRVSSARGAR